MLSAAIPFVSWALGSKVGRYFVSGAIIAALVGLAFLRVYKGGREYEKSKQTQRQLENLQRAIRIGGEVRNLDAVERRRRVDKWLRPAD